MKRMRARPSCSALAAAGLLCIVAAGASAAEPIVAVSVTGPPETIFRYTTDACEKDDLPDAPARAFRDAAGTVHLIASHFVNRAMTGPGLATLRHDCRVLFRGGGSTDPTRFDDHAWLMSFYTRDGQTILALVHNEFHGQRNRALCLSGKYIECWRNALTAAISRDGGWTFTQAEPPNHLVASLPYPYRGDLGRPAGYFGPTNAITRDGAVYVLAATENYEAQQWGMCLLRTTQPEDPRAWRAWDGAGFSVRFVDPNREKIEAPERHVCAPVGKGRLTGSLTSVVRHRSGLYVATMISRQVALPGGERASGIFVSTSPDLVTWSAPSLVWKVPIRSDKTCDDPMTASYPALLDPDSPSPIFETAGDSAFLFVTRFNLKDCKLGLDRDLIRLPVRLSVVDAPPAKKP